MGDNFHFLEQQQKRLSDSAYTKRAMVLYNNSDLTKSILDYAKMPDGRVGISLDEGDDGPFLLVESTGCAVTFLDKGMKLYNATLLPYSRLATAMERVSDWQDRWETAVKLLGPNGDIRSLMTRLVEAGRDLTREEFRALSAWQLPLRGEMLSTLLQLYLSVEKERQELRTLRKVRSRDEPRLRRHWNHTWALGHLTLLVAMDGREYMESLTDEWAWARGPRLSFLTIAQGIIPLALRGAWAVGEIGRPALAEYRDGFAQAKTPLTLLTAILGLLAIGAHHERLRGQVRKALARTLEFPATASGHTMKIMQAHGLAVSELAFDNPGDWRRSTEDGLAQLFLESIVPKLRPGSSFCYSDPKEVPLDLKLGMIGWMPALFGQNENLLHLLYRVTPLVAMERPEILYFPKAVHDDLLTPWHPEQTLNLLRSQFLQRPVQAEPKPGRNDPCSCGSGRKYKQCHGN